MNTIKIYDPAMCCSTGVCGPNINPQLLRVSTIINKLKQKGIMIERYNLNSNPNDFVCNEKVNELMKVEGTRILPITCVNDEVVKTKEYLTNDEFSKYLNIPIADILTMNTNNHNKFIRK